MIHLSTFLSLTATALLASANPQFVPPSTPAIAPAGSEVGSIVSNALAAAPIPSAIAPLLGSAVAAVQAVPNNATADLIPGLNVPPTQLFDNILAALSILDVVLTLLNLSKFTDSGNQTVKIGDFDIPLPSFSDSDSSSEDSLGVIITALITLITPLLSTDSGQAWLFLKSGFGEIHFRIRGLYSALINHLQILLLFTSLESTMGYRV